MPPDFMEMVARIAEAMAPVLFAAALMGGFVLIARAKRTRPSRPPTDLDRFDETVASLKEAVDMLRVEVEDVQGRLEFTERLLTQASDMPEPHEEEATPV